ncbi:MULTISPECIES: DUF6077 domain-containing protein [Coprobacillaceae]|uniref:DUF6077 domain-containing protein n=1 Tax=Coprobacillaceae TaxID=2810280 RepID=UPI000E48BD61|nr:MULTISPECIES: DUF6077 domain-containing protein [Coprobacillaceae]RHM59401.1 hypothetical protein DWZ53_09475 [Coprobacillus sp. AF33-1AC]RHS91753.1 hypothetical protein DW911_09730 [Erysipelatoclostridium sp. AM42-17]
MNHILTVVFLLTIFFYYWILGDTISNIFEIKIKSTIVSVICGFITTFFISFIIGLPCQYFKLNWYIFFYTFTFIVVLSFAFLLYKKYKNFEGFKLFVKNHFSKERILNHLKNNWVLYVFVTLFTVFSVSNVMALYEFDYDDTFYIGKVVNSISTPALLNEDFFTGKLVSWTDMTRIVNTYEITYAAFSSMFHINPIYLCKVSMVIHNYILFTISIKQLSNLISKKNAQYALLPFFVFLINHGYLMLNSNFITIRSYDLWQFQNAVWYGGSVVRVLSIPILCIITIPLIENRITIKNTIFIFMISCTMMSFSSIFAPIFVVMFFILFILKFAYNTYLSIKQKKIKSVILNVFLLFCFIFGLLITKKLDHSPFLSVDNYNYFNSELYPFYCYYLTVDSIMRFSKFIILVSLLLTVNSKYGKYLSIITCMLVAIVCSNYFNELLCVTSFKFFFVILRFYSSVQFMIVLLVGLMIVKAFDVIKFKSLVLSFASLAIAGNLCVIHNNYKEIKSISFLGCGLNSDGYDFGQITKYDNLMLDIFNDVGSYFNRLPYGNYTLLAPESFTYNGRITYQLGFYLSSNRIQIERSTSLDAIGLQYRTLINDYLNKNISYQEAKSAFSYYKGSYLLTFSKKQAIELKELGYTIVHKTKKYAVIHI